jgi:hypothetical protein
MQVPNPIKIGGNWHSHKIGIPPYLPINIGKQVRIPCPSIRGTVNFLSKASAVNMRCRAVLDWTERFTAAQYIQNSLCSLSGRGERGGGKFCQCFLNMKHWGGGWWGVTSGVGGGIPLPTQRPNQATYGNNITPLSLIGIY